MRGKSNSDDPVEHVLSVASKLFYEEGIRAVGIDRIQRESGVARATLYRHFPTKDSLAAEVIERRDSLYRTWLTQFVNRYPPAERPLAIFDAVAERIATVGFRGCAFTNTISEFPDPAHPAHIAAKKHKQLVRDYFEELCRDAAAADPATLAGQLLLLLDGAVVSAVRAGENSPALLARQIAQTLLDASRIPAITKSQSEPPS